MTATALCRGFNQPNYSLITANENMEQMTHTTHILRHPLTHTCNQSQLTPATFHRWYGSCTVKQMTPTAQKKMLHQWQCKRMLLQEPNYGGVENFLPSWQDVAGSDPGKLWRLTIRLLQQSSKRCHYLRKCKTIRFESLVLWGLKKKQGLPWRTGKMVMQAVLGLLQLIPMLTLFWWVILKWQCDKPTLSLYKSFICYFVLLTWLYAKMLNN